MLRVKDEERICNYVIQEIINRNSGRADETCLYDKPSERYFIGNLAPVGNQDTTTGENYEEESYIKKLNPSSIGLETLFEIPRDKKIEFKVNIAFSVFYRFYPAFEYCIKDGFVDLPNAYKKITCNVETKEISINTTDINSLNTAKEIINNALSSEISKSHEIILNDPSAIKKGTKKKHFQEIKTQQDYLDLINRIPDEKVLVNWEPIIQLKYNNYSDNIGRIKIYLVNNTADTSKRNTEPFLFDCSLGLTLINSKFYPFQFHQLPKDYRYNRDYYGIGYNCFVAMDNQQKMYTQHCPVYKQKRYVTSNTVVPLYKQLMSKPEPVLKKT